jgi:uncharacterized membrane protein
VTDASVPDKPIRTPTRFPAERAKTFVDAVVAIAMTLLILPLMESISEAASAQSSAADWYSEHVGQLLGFVLSFAVIAVFWITHHRVFSRVHQVSTGLLWLVAAWLLTIVWLPVATAMSGQMAATDPMVRLTYIGSMFLIALLLIFIRLYLRAHPELHDMPPDVVRRGLIAEIVLASLFLVALAVSLLVPSLGYWPLLLLVLSAFLPRVVGRGVTSSGGA